MRAYILLMRVANSTEGLLGVSKLYEELKIEIGSSEFFGFKMAFNLLCERGSIMQVDQEGELFQLTEAGKREIDSLRKFWRVEK